RCVGVSLSQAAEPRMQFTDVLAKYGMISAFLAVVIAFGLLRPAFFSLANFSDILVSASITFFIALGVTFSLTVNGFDLSIGSVASLSSMLAAGLMVLNAGNLAEAIVLPLAVSAAIGLINAALIVKARIPDLLVTLGTMFIVQGAQETYSDGKNIYPHMFLNSGQMAPGTFLPGFVYLANGTLLGVPFPIWLMAVVGLASWVFLERTEFGRYFYAVGANQEAARLSGVRVDRYRVLAYVISALFAGFGGILLASFLQSGENLAGAPYMLNTVTAAFLGFSLFGLNRANVAGTLIGSLFLAVFLTGMTMLNVPYTMQDIFKGALLIGAIALTYISRRS
ncbi:MAG: ABC transporter permease, partial [Alicyclobacillus sp.]|nr:ABC transporter permease [Alicyclobacillus sp.]